MGQAGTFVKLLMQPEKQEIPSFPRRQKSWLKSSNRLFSQQFLNTKQDSRLRGNGGSLMILGFAKFSGCLGA